MARFESKGEVRFVGGSWQTRIRTFDRRDTFKLPTCRDKTEAEARSALLSDIAKRFRLAQSIEARAMESLTLVASASVRSLQNAITVAEDLLGGRIPVKDAPKILTVAEVAEKWLKLRRAEQERGDVAPSTVDDNEAHLEAHIVPMLGDCPVEGGLGSARLRQFVADLRTKPRTRNGKNKTRMPMPGKPLSNNTVRNIAATLGKMLTDAMAEEWVNLMANPMHHDAVKLPPAETRANGEVIYVERRDAEALLSHSETDTEHKDRYTMLFLTGIDVGELAGLDWRHAADAPVPHIEITRIFNSRTKDYGPTKRPSRVRKVPLHPLVVAMLKERKATRWPALVGREPGPNDPIFPDCNGLPYYWDDAADALRADLVRAGCSATRNGHAITAKSTRRSFSTWLHEEGFEESIVGRLLGHAKKTVTGKHYTATDLAMLYRVVTSIDLNLGGKPRSPETPTDCPTIAPHMAPPARIERATFGLGNHRRSITNEQETSDSEKKREVDETSAQTRTDVSAPVGHATGQSGGNEPSAPDAVEVALADALTRASAAGQWATVETLSRELTARRGARAGVVVLDAARKRRER